MRCVECVHLIYIGRMDTKEWCYKQRTYCDVGGLETEIDDIHEEAYCQFFELRRKCSNCIHNICEVKKYQLKNNIVAINRKGGCEYNGKEFRSISDCCKKWEEKV